MHKRFTSLKIPDIRSMPSRTSKGRKKWEHDETLKQYKDQEFAHYEYSDNWLGLYRPNPSVPGGVTEFSISINKRTISDLQVKDYPNSSYYTVAINTAVHEFGHALYLDDQPDGDYDVSIMSYDRNRIDNTPRDHDIQDIKNYRN